MFFFRNTIQHFSDKTRQLSGWPIFAMMTLGEAKDMPKFHEIHEMVTSGCGIFSFFCQRRKPLGTTSKCHKSLFCSSCSIAKLNKYIVLLWLIFFNIWHIHMYYSSWYFQIRFFIFPLKSESQPCWSKVCKVTWFMTANCVKTSSLLSSFLFTHFSTDSVCDFGILLKMQHFSLYQSRCLLNFSYRMC